MAPLTRHFLHCACAAIAYLGNVLNFSQKVHGTADAHNVLLHSGCAANLPWQCPQFLPHTVVHGTAHAHHALLHCACAAIAFLGKVLNFSHIVNGTAHAHRVLLHCACAAIAYLGNVLDFCNIVHGTANAHHVLLHSMAEIVPLLA
jgi:hypothetical protein